jgi:hypothetical protein
MAAELTPEIEKSLDWLFSALDGKLADGVPARILESTTMGRIGSRSRAAMMTSTPLFVRLFRFASVFNAVAASRRWSCSGTSTPRIVRAMSLV